MADGFSSQIQRKRNASFQGGSSLLGAAKTRVEACPCAAHAAIETPAWDAGSPLWLTEHGQGPLQVRACVRVCVCVLVRQPSPLTDISPPAGKLLQKRGETRVKVIPPSNRCPHITLTRTHPRGCPSIKHVSKQVSICEDYTGPTMT